MDILKDFQAHPHWSFVQTVLDTLTDSGFQAFLVGGSVRDALMGAKVKDFDVATSARPDQVEDLFPKTIPIGKEFGVVAVVVADHLTVEVTSFRKESEYNSKRQPTQIEFTDLEGDASRRDFTLNALYFDVQKNNVIDPFGGRKDIEDKTLRAIGLAEERLKEDPLRILRAIRFQARFDFSIDPLLEKALVDNKKSLERISVERVFEELQKSFQNSSWRRALALFSKFSIWPVIGLPSPEPSDLAKIESIQVEGGLIEVLGWMWRFFSAEQIALYLKKLKASNEFKKNLIFFINQGQRLLKDPLRKAEIYCLYAESPDGFLNYLEGVAQLDDLYDRFHRLQELFVQAQNLMVEGSLPKPLATGEELLKRGIKKGPSMGALKKELYFRQLEGEWSSLTHLDNQINKILHTNSEV